MMKCLYLLSFVFHVAAGCALSGDKHVDVVGHEGGSVLLPCSCSDLHTKPQKFTWESYRTRRPTEMLNDEHYRGRLQLFNNISPANLSLLISDLRKQDQGAYRCSSEKEHTVIRLYVNGCALSGDKNQVVITQQGASVLLPCSCSDLRTKPQTFTWESYRTGHPTEMLNDERYHGRLQLFNNISPANLSLLISDLREEDQRAYRCSTEKEHRDIWLHVNEGRRETSKQSRKTDTTPPSEQPQSKTANSPPASFSTIQGGRCGENVITDGRQDCEGKQEDQTVPDVETFCIK